MNFPGALHGIEPATGLLVRGININGKYLLVDSCSVMPTQETKMEWYLQGGPRASIADINTREIKGNIEFPLRVLSDGSLEDGAIEILVNAENPNRALKIDTNHTLLTTRIVADCGGTDNNELLTLDCLVIENLSITAAPQQGIKVSATVTGTLTSRHSADYIAPSSDKIIGRQLSFQDCNAGRLQSSMINVDEISISITNQVNKTKFFVPYPYGTESRFDMPQFVMTYNHLWGGYFQEVLRRGIEYENYIHGGIMQGENLSIEFGPLVATVQVPVFKISEQPYNHELLKRKTEFYSQNYPSYTDLAAGKLFNLAVNTNNCHVQAQ